MTTTLAKVALRRKDPNAPMGTPSPLVAWCPCGTVVDMTPAPVECPICARVFSPSGWITEPTIDRSVPTAVNQRWHASNQPLEDLKRHASVHLDNGIGEDESFCGQCVAVLQARRARGEAI